MIIEWMPGREEHNFGDHMSGLLGSLFVDHAWRDMCTTRDRAYYLLGSVICDWCIESSLRDGMTPYFVGCGYRGDQISRSAAELCAFYGCRGYLTKSTLKEVGKDVDVISDPAIVVPLLVQAGRRDGLTLLVPHVLDPKRGNYDALVAGCDQEISAVTRSVDDVIRIITKISGAKFVLAGALHSAITAYAYRVPFAFLEDGYVDCRPKWVDWCTSIGLSKDEVAFHQDAKAGKEWYASIASKLIWRPVSPILDQFAKVGPIKHSIRDAATNYDARRNI